MFNNYLLIRMLADDCQHTQPFWIWQCKLQGVDALGFSVKHICCTLLNFLYPKYAATLTHLNLSVDGGHIDLYVELASESFWLLNSLTFLLYQRSHKHSLLFPNAPAACALHAVCVRHHTHNHQSHTPNVVVMWWGFLTSVAAPFCLRIGPKPPRNGFTTTSQQLR